MSSEVTAQLSAEEKEQILQTIEMFEVITQANPNDCQSLEVLKEAYWKIDRFEDALETSRRLAETYVSLGQYSSAVLEYEGILQKDPDNLDVVAMLGELEAKLSDNGNKKLRRLNSKPSGEDDLSLDFDLGTPDDDATLIATNATHHTTGRKKVDLTSDGNESLSKFLIQHNIAAEEAVKSALERVRTSNEALTDSAVAASLVGELVSERAVEMETILNGILDRTKFAYAPLEYYDVDRQIVKMLPESLTLGRLILPFDVMSRTIMIAMANPFDAVGKEAVQQVVDYNIQWHVASPEAIARILSSVYKLAPR